MALAAAAVAIVAVVAVVVSSPLRVQALLDLHQDAVADLLGK